MVVTIKVLENMYEEAQQWYDDSDWPLISM